MNSKLLFLTTSLFAAIEEKSLIHPQYIKKYLTHQAPFADSHGAKGTDLGGGMLYYSLAYIKKAKLCVCLGSGGGFVPRLMRQAQRDLNLQDSKTILIDANIGPYGRPAWLNESHFFRQNFADVEIILKKTEEAAREWSHGKIDYLHIDADHSFEGAYQDFLDFLPLINPDGIITFHDTNGDLPCSKVIPLLKEQGYELINFKSLGAGVALISPK